MDRNTSRDGAKKRDKKFDYAGTWKGKRVKKHGPTFRDHYRTIRPPQPGSRLTGDGTCGATVEGQRCTLDRSHDGYCWWHIRQHEACKPFTPIPSVKERTPRTGHRGGKRRGRLYVIEHALWVRCADPDGGPDRFAVAEPEWTVILAAPYWHWQVEQSDRTWYAIDRWTGRTMHGVLYGKPPGDLTLDHQDRHGWNNRLGNVVPATAEQQAANRSKPGAPREPQEWCSNPGCVGAIVPPGMVAPWGDPACPSCLTMIRGREAGDARYGKGTFDRHWPHGWEVPF